MSWFSNRFSASFEAPEALHGDGDGEPDDEHTPQQGKGVKEDLSELTKTFTRHLWGVASFLAPPPTTKTPHEQVDPSSPSSSDHHIVPDLQIDPFLPSGESSLSNELVDVDFQASPRPLERLQENSLHQILVDDPSVSLDPSSDHRLIGIGKDLAELKGSVATGLSRFLKVVRDEIDRNEHAKQQSEDVDEEGDDFDDNEEESESTVHTGRLPMLNSLLRPLLSTIIHKDVDGNLKNKSEDESFDPDYEEGYDDDVHGHHMSRPLVAFNLQQTMGESLGGISKLASSLFPVSLDSDDERDGADTHNFGEAVGLTEEVLVFAKTVSMHPETWLDFPLFTDDEEDDDFEMSNAQKEHIHEVEHASPRLAALRIELCPDYMSEGRFWKIYFVLLHSRLSKKDAVLLSTPQIMEARALLLNNLQKKEFQGGTNEDDGHNELEQNELTSGTAQSFKIVSLQSAMEVPAKDFDQIETLGANQGRPQISGHATNDIVEEVQNKNVLASTVKLAALNVEDEEADADRWLHEETSPHLGLATTALGNEDDVSFSDLEEDDESFNPKNVGSSSIKGSHGWVDLNKEQDGQQFESLGISAGSKLKGEPQAWANRKQDRREPNDWLTVEEDDVDFD